MFDSCELIQLLLDWQPHLIHISKPNRMYRKILCMGRVRACCTLNCCVLKA